MENPNLVYQETGYSKSPTHSRLADCGSRQAIQARPHHSNRMVSPGRGFPSNMLPVAQVPRGPISHQVCNRWHQPQIGLFATRFNNKLAQFVSPVPDPLAWVLNALSLPWEDLDLYSFPQVAILGKVVEKLQDYPCRRTILIAPGWPNMPWDLGTMSGQIPLCLPNLPNMLTQPFNQTPLRNLSNLNLHAWLLELQQLRSRASLRQWQHELRLFREDQQDQSMRQSGPFL